MSRDFAVRRSADAGRDLALIFDHLNESYLALGEDPAGAFDRAANRIRAIDSAMERLGRTPFQGTVREDLMPGLRQVTKDSAIFYFVIDEPRERELMCWPCFSAGRITSGGCCAGLWRSEGGIWLSRRFTVYFDDRLRVSSALNWAILKIRSWGTGSANRKRIVPLLISYLASSSLKALSRASLTG